MSKSKKPSEEPAKDSVTEEVIELDVVEGADSTAEDAEDGTLGVANKTKAERDAEKAEARRESEREALRRRTTPQPVKLDGGKNPKWWVPTMLSLMGAGLLWLVVYYLSTTMEPNAKGERPTYPIPALENWNMAVGFVLIMAGFIMTTRWK